MCTVQRYSLFLNYSPAESCYLNIAYNKSLIISTASLFVGTLSPGNQPSPFPGNQDAMMMAAHNQTLSPNSQLAPARSPQGTMASPPFSQGMTSPLTSPMAGLNQVAATAQRSQPGFPMTTMTNTAQNFTDPQAMFAANLQHDRWVQGLTCNIGLTDRKDWKLNDESVEIGVIL